MPGFSGRQGDFGTDAHLFAEEAVGDAAEDARPVACFPVAAYGAAVLQVPEDGEGIGNDGVAGPAIEVGQEAQSAGIPLVGGIVESGSLGEAGFDRTSRVV